MNRRLGYTPAMKIYLAAWILGITGFVSLTEASPPDPVTVHVFHRDAVQFVPGDSGRVDPGPVQTGDRGRTIRRTLDLPRFDYPVRILARVTTRPVPKDAASVSDPWDRAGAVTLILPGAPEVDLVKFITAYGGLTTHEVEVTRLAPLLTGRCTFQGFIDTWLAPAWTLDFSLVFEPAETGAMPAWMEEWSDGLESRATDWALPVLHETLDRERMDAGPVIVPVTIPPGIRRVRLDYLVSGHCTDGRDADEFVSKPNVVTIDGKEVLRYLPWRDDCRRFRDVNPYCRRWFDGSWSADYSRSGWCPGDAVLPRSVEVGSLLAPGDHEIGFTIEDIRPADDSGYGYWRVSAVLAGWKD